MTARPVIELRGVPVLTTARLRLRAPRAQDFDAFAAYCASDRSRFTGGPQTREEAWRAFCHIVGHWALRGYGFFVAEMRDTGQAVGTFGPWFPEGWPEPEIGWSVWDDAGEGRGLAHEAAVATRDFAREALGWPTAISLIDAANTRSQALATRLGCVAEGPGTVMGKPCVIWRHPAPDAPGDGGMKACA